MDPVAGGDAPGDRRRLGDLVLVVGEDVVDAAGVDVELRPEIPHRHRGAFQVPAGKALAPAGRRPLEDPAVPGGLPEREVGRVALVRLDVAPVPGAQVGQRVARQLPISLEPPDVVVDVPVLGGVGVSRVLERLRKREHLGDVVGGPREDVRGQDVDQRLVGVEGRLVRVGDLSRSLVFEAGGDEHRIGSAVEPLVAQVSDVGDVLDLEDVDAVIKQRPPDQVGKEIAAQVADVGVAVDGRAAGVHPHPAGLERLDGFDPSSEGVAEAQRHQDTCSHGHVLFLFVGTSQPAITFRTRARYPSRGLAGPSHRSPGGVDLRGLIPCPETARQGSSATGPILPAMRRLFVFLVAATLFASCGGQSAAGSDRPVRILAGSPTTLDPAAQGDAGSAAVTAQLFESLTSFDADLQVRPALAESWQFSADGRQVTFHLRPDLTFSDGSPLRPSDVTRSWLRLIDPAHPSPLASLALDIAGADAYLRGTATDPATVGLHADDASGDLVVDLVRPATDFVNIVAGPTFSVVPPGVGEGAAALTPGKDFVASGGYTLSGETASGLTLTANPRYWAGKPAVTTIELVGDLGGKGPVDAFAAGDLDYTSVFGIDATWLAYDESSDRSSAWSIRCRRSTTGSIPASRRSTTCASGRPSGRPSTGGGWPP